jgi:transcriptional antiterminator
MEEYNQKQFHKDKILAILFLLKYKSIDINVLAECFNISKSEIVKEIDNRNNVNC